jgi:methylmalonyl-CoA mutase cobalamin-binding subunit
LLGGGDFVDAFAVALDELERFVEAILEVIDPPLLGDLVLEAARDDEDVYGVSSSRSAHVDDRLLAACVSIVRRRGIVCDQAIVGPTITPSGELPKKLMKRAERP